MRVHVPRPSQKDYVVRPKSNVEGQFRGATKNRSNSRFDRTQRNSKSVQNSSYCNELSFQFRVQIMNGT
uniref:Uncharacterized protein n=1 Tax=Wuchereria bancrofti TaxID=6293 RepID=A0A1I8EWW8_WUCBA